jgi:hypothetical protein
MTVSNSGKILVFNTGNFETVATIAGLTAPRYILPVGADKAVVSDLRNPYLSILNLKNYTIEDQVYIGTGTEQMVSIGENLFAASWSFNNKIFKVNATTMVVTDSITVGIQPNSMVKGKDGNLWVLCDGGYSGNWFGHENARLVKVDPQNMDILKE